MTESTAVKKKHLAKRFKEHLDNARPGRLMDNVRLGRLSRCLRQSQVF